MKRSKAKVITARDKEIIRFIGEHECATAAQIKTRFWPDAQLLTCETRLAQLRRAGYLTTREYGEKEQDQTTIFQATKKAAQELSPEYAKHIYVKEIAEREIAERLAGVSVRLKLEERGYKVAQWVSGRDLQRTQMRKVHQAGRTSHVVDTIADAQAVIIDQETGEIETVNVEIDGQYYGKMLQQKVSGFNNNQKTIWATSDRRAGIVDRAIQNHGHNQEVMII